MRVRVWLAAMVLGLLGASACGRGNNDGPIADTPLTGTVGGTSFAAKSALAYTDMGTFPFENNVVTIYEIDSTCLTGRPVVDRSLVLYDLPLLTGTAFEFGGPQNVAFVFKQSSGGWSNNTSDDGRVQVIQGAVAGGVGTIKLRARDDQDSVEGAVDVQVCSN